MTTLTIELPEALDAQLSLASERTNMSKQILAKRALQEFLSLQAENVAPARTVADVASHLFGVIDIDAPTDISINKNYFEGFGE